MSKKNVALNEEQESQNLVEEQEFDSQDIVERSQGFLQKNRILLIAAAAAIVIVVAAIFIFVNARNTAENEASLALSRIMPVYQQNDLEKALNGDPAMLIRGTALQGLRSIADQYESTDAGKVAALLAGNALVATQKPSEALKYFDIASSAGADDIKAGAAAGVGTCNEFEGKFDEAANNYEKASQLAPLDAVKSRYQYYAAICYEKVGNKEKALELYKSLVDEFQMTEFAASAKKGLVRLGTIIE